jgi:hypothetical protein
MRGLYHYNAAVMMAVVETAASRILMDMAGPKAVKESATNGLTAIGSVLFSNKEAWEQQMGFQKKAEKLS